MLTVAVRKSGLTKELQEDNGAKRFLFPKPSFLFRAGASERGLRGAKAGSAHIFQGSVNKQLEITANVSTGPPRSHNPPQKSAVEGRGSSAENA